MEDVRQWTRQGSEHLRDLIFSIENAFCTSEPRLLACQHMAGSGGRKGKVTMKISALGTFFRKCLQQNECSGEK